MLWSIRFSAAAIIIGSTLLAATYALDRESGPFGAGASVLFFTGFVLFNTSLMVYRCQVSSVSLENLVFSLVAGERAIEEKCSFVQSLDRPKCHILRTSLTCMAIISGLVSTNRII